MSTIPLPRYSADITAAPTNVPNTPPAAGLLPYTNFSDPDVVARGYAQLKSAYAERARVERLEDAAVMTAIEGGLDAIGRIAEAERKAQDKEDRLSALRLYEDYRTRLDAVEVEASRTYAKHQDYLATVEVARGKLMADVFQRAANDNQRLILEQHVTPYNIENRRAVLQTANAKRVQGILGDATVTINAETARLVASEHDGELKGAALVLDEAFRHLQGVVPADKLEEIYQDTVRRAMQDRLDREVLENPQRLLRGGLSDYEPGGRIAALFPRVQFRADAVAKARDDAKARVQAMEREALAREEAARRRALEETKTQVTQQIVELYSVMARGGHPAGLPELRDKIAYVREHAHVLGLAAAKQIEEDLIRSEVGEYPAPGQEARVLVGIYTGEIKSAETLLALQGLTAEQKVSLVNKYYERQRTFPYNTDQFTTGVSMISRAVLGVDPVRSMPGGSMLSGFLPDLRVSPETAAAWRAAIMEFYAQAHGVREENLGDLLKIANDIAARYTPKPRTSAPRTPAPAPSSTPGTVPSTSPWRPPYSPPR